MNFIYVFEQLFIPLTPFLGKNELSFIYFNNDVLLTVFIIPLISFIILFVFGTY
jgi:hypothetical protein